MNTSPAMSTFDEVNVFFDRAADRLGMADGVREMLRSPWRELRVTVPVRMDNGEIEVFTGYRIQHNGARGPNKGGVRIHPDADEEEVRALEQEDREIARRMEQRRERGRGSGARRGRRR